MSSAQMFRSAVERQDVEAGIALLAPDVTFRSPVVYRPYEGAEAVGVLLRAVFEVFEDFSYLTETSSTDGRDHVLVFQARVGDRELMGVDILRENEAGRISDFTVMVRPLSGALALAEAMKAKLGG
jgi:hypothetical protein